MADITVVKEMKKLYWFLRQTERKNYFDMYCSLQEKCMNSDRQTAFQLYNGAWKPNCFALKRGFQKPPLYALAYTLGLITGW